MNLSRELFWDVDPEQIDEETNARFIIERVMTRGTMSDLDFFTQTDFDLQKLLQALKSKFEIIITGRDPTSLNCRINGIKVDLLRYTYPLLSKPKIVEGIAIWSIEDIAAAKISAITNRGAKKDFYDLEEILKTIPLNSVLSLYERKYPSANRFMAIKSRMQVNSPQSAPFIFLQKSRQTN